MIIIGHTSEYRWEVWDFRRNQIQGFLVANWIEKFGKTYRNWIFSEQNTGNTEKIPEHKAAWHGAGMLYYSKEDLVKRLWSG